MSTIALCMFFEPGHILPTLRLAHGLRAAGHRVVYMTIPDFEAELRAHGFETEVLLAGRYPAGAIERLQRQPRADYTALSFELYLALLDSLLDDAFAGHLRAVAPDLLLFDSVLTPVMMAALSWKVPCVRVCTSLPRQQAPGVPPLTTSLPFGDTPERRAAAERAWDQVVAGAVADPDTELARSAVRRERQLADKFDFSMDRLDLRAVFAAELASVPELVLCAPELDFPRPAGGPCRYSESLMLDRQPVDFPWHRLDPGRPLVLCSLGSQSYRIPGALRFFSEVMAVAAARRDWQLVLAVGPRWTPGDFPAVPDNAVIVPFAPQVALLSRASAVITHAGLGTIKESIWFEAPMLAFPLYYDQPGNGARIAHHGLGLVGDFDTVTAPELVDMIERVHADVELPARMAAMRRGFEALERTCPGRGFVHGLLAGT